jgi:hypothetical protein
MKDRTEVVMAVVSPHVKEGHRYQEECSDNCVKVTILNHEEIQDDQYPPPSDEPYSYSASDEQWNGDREEV